MSVNLTDQEKAAARVLGITQEEYERHKALHPERPVTGTPAERARERAETAERERVRGLVREVLVERDGS